MLLLSHILIIIRRSSRTKNKTPNYNDSLTQKQTMGANCDDNEESEEDENDDFKDVPENEESEDISGEETYRSQPEPQEENPEDPPTPPYQKSSKRVPNTKRISATSPRKAKFVYLQ
jgi:hypothetical protein